MLVVGPAYLRMFRIGTDYMWWPEDRSRLVDLVPENLKSDYAIIFDADEHVGWIQSRGFLTPAECMPR